jgi:hypothetical protein
VDEHCLSAAAGRAGDLLPALLPATQGQELPLPIPRQPTGRDQRRSALLPLLRRTPSLRSRITAAGSHAAVQPQRRPHPHQVNRNLSSTQLYLSHSVIHYPEKPELRHQQQLLLGALRTHLPLFGRHRPLSAVYSPANRCFNYSAFQPHGSPQPLR